ncbi:MAG TPA: ABC transporter permease subunit [Gammaproteobacteria bacterium]|jgi:His/Glu/Gln/Arg/opine family amino acid ABC transporter permease subunit|nr:ABC transporter permease subunit [Gammaproteobacteria bacterium]
MSGFIDQIISSTVMTIELAIFALLLGLVVGLVGSLLESISIRWLRYIAASLIFIIRGLPEVLVLFFIFFGLTAVLSQLFNTFIDINAFAAGVLSLGLIFGAYASQVFRGAFLAIDQGQLDAGRAVGFSPLQVIFLIQLPQAWRHALPGLGNLWLILVKDTAIVSLIGLPEMMNQAKLAASTTNQPFLYYLIAALLYLIITSVSQVVIRFLSDRANRYIS